MNVITNPLAILTFLPLLGFLLVLLLPGGKKAAIRWTALITTLVNFGVSLWMLAGFDKTNPNPQFGLDLLWASLGGLDIRFHLGVDGLSILLVLLTTFLMPLVILASWKSIQEQVKGYMAFFLLLETGMLGVFLSLDLVLFYIFWEFSLIPMYFLIGVWGGERRVYAAVKFFLFTMAGSVLMLIAILYLGITAGTFSVPDLMSSMNLPQNVQMWLFLAFALAFAIKVPIWPLHTWLPDAHVEAPTAGSVILAGVLLKMGTYGFLRFNLGMFPEIAKGGRPLAGRSGGHRHPVRRGRCLYAKGCQEAGRLFIRFPPGLCHFRLVCIEPTGSRGCHPADDQSRLEHGCAVPDRWHAVRTPAHPRPGGLWWFMAGSSPAGVADPDRHPLLTRIARFEWLYR